MLDFNTYLSKIKCHTDLANMIYHCIKFEDLEGKSLKEIMTIEIGEKLSISNVENWLKSLPEICVIPYENSQIKEILKLAGNSHWSVDDYWKWSACRVLDFAKCPKAYS